MSIFNRLVNLFFGLSPEIWEEYYNRFIAPKRAWARAQGIPEDEIDRLWSIAMEQSDANLPPGLCFQVQLNLWLAEHAEVQS